MVKKYRLLSLALFFLLLSHGSLWVKEIVEKPKRNEIVEKPKRNEIVEKPKRNEIVEKPKRNEIVEKPKRKKVKSYIWEVIACVALVVFLGKTRRPIRPNLNRRPIRPNLNRRPIRPNLKMNSYDFLRKFRSMRPSNHKFIPENRIEAIKKIEKMEEFKALHVVDRRTVRDEIYKEYEKKWMLSTIGTKQIQVTV